jgi:nucleoside-diphosphate-sugar epimerase
MALYLVTSGAGFIGSHIVEALVERGQKVRVLDNFSTGRHDNLQDAAPNSVEIIEGDVLDVETVRRAMEGVSYVLHQAALVSVQPWPTRWGPTPERDGFAQLMIWGGKLT